MSAKPLRMRTQRSESCIAICKSELASFQPTCIADIGPLGLARRERPSGGTSILLIHSPELLKYTALRMAPTVPI